MSCRTSLRRVLVVAAVALAAGLVAGRPAAGELRADELVLVVNKNEPAGAELAAFYAQQRGVPAGRVVSLDLPTGDDLPADVYAERVVPAVRAYLRDHRLEQPVRCLVTFYGVPLRIAARVNTPAEKAEVTSLLVRLDGLAQRLRPGVEAVEAVAKRLDPTFTAATGLKRDELELRWAAATRVVGAQLATIPDPAHRAELTRQFFLAAAPLMGKAYDNNAARIDLEQHPDRQAVDGPKLAAAVAAYQQAAVEAGRWEERPDDPTARANFRKLAEDNFGLLRYGRLIINQLDYLDERHGGQAFDSELALILWREHLHNYVNGFPYAVGAAAGRPLWVPNALNYLRAGPAAAAGPRTLMVSRLDGPTPALVKAMIATSVRVEQQGLHGRIVIDGMGSRPGQDPEGHPGYGGYDATLRNLNELLAGRKGVDVLFDDKPDVLPPHSASDVAVYCGWYAVNGYVPSCAFAGGAVGMHVASYTATTLRDSPHPNWAVGLLDDGAVATIGPVAEPYLFAFPRADDFFPLLLTGRLTLAECYWRTEAVVSWQMTCVGDPLYTPYKADPVLAVADLPLRLRGLFGGATTVPALPVK